MDRPGLKYVLEQQILPFWKPSRHALGHTHTVNQWVPWLFPGSKAAGLWFDCQLLSSSEVKNWWMPSESGQGLLYFGGWNILQYYQCRIPYCTV